MASPTTTYRLRVRNLAQLVTVSSDGSTCKKGAAMNEVAIIPNGTIIVGHDGLIADVGPDAELAERHRDATFEVDMDGSGKCVLPGLVDGHTHPVWSGDRVHEFAMKLAGATYMDVHRAGGGIHFTVRHTRESSEEELLALLLPRLDRMLRAGTTVVEAKSGYGLDVESELKMLRVLRRAAEVHPIEIVATFCGAHAVPPGRTAEEAAEDVVRNQLPAVLRENAAGRTAAENLDVFCEKGVFERELSERIMRAGREAGLCINFHGDELHAMGAGTLGAAVGAHAISHLEEVDEEGMRAMAEHGIFAVLLPTTAHVLRLTPPPARGLIEAGVPVALGSDFNPNAHCLAMPLVMHLACVNMRMTMNEALVAATLNAAESLRRGRTHGSLEVGKAGDMLLLDAPRWEHMLYQLGDPPVHGVVKRGKVVFQAQAWRATA